MKNSPRSPKAVQIDGLDFSDSRLVQSPQSTTPFRGWTAGLSSQDEKDLSEDIEHEETVHALKAQIEALEKQIAHVNEQTAQAKFKAGLLQIRIHDARQRGDRLEALMAVQSLQGSPS